MAYKLYIYVTSSRVQCLFASVPRGKPFLRSSLSFVSVGAKIDRLRSKRDKSTNDENITLTLILTLTLEESDKSTNDENIQQERHPVFARDCH